MLLDVVWTLRCMLCSRGWGIWYPQNLTSLFRNSCIWRRFPTVCVSLFTVKVPAFGMRSSLT